MDTRIVDCPAFRLVGRAARVPLIHHGINPHIQQHIAALPKEEHMRLKALSDTEPRGLLAVSDDLDPDRTEGSELTYLHGVAISRDAQVPHDLDTIEVPGGTWAVFRSAGAVERLGRHCDRVVPLQPVASAARSRNRRRARTSRRLQHRHLRAVVARRAHVSLPVPDSTRIRPSDLHPDHEPVLDTLLSWSDGRAAPDRPAV
jgi:predicted transcriptional regulator YdeE